MSICIAHNRAVPLIRSMHEILLVGTECVGTLSLFNLAVPAPHLLSLFLALQPSPPWKSQIARLSMHHLVFKINFHIHFVSSPFLSWFTSSTCQSYHPHSRHPSLVHSFTPDSKPTLSTNPFHLRLLLYVLDCLCDNGTGPDLSRSSIYF